jgi:hypothetical protein
MNALLPSTALTAAAQTEIYIYLQLVAVLTLLLLLIGRELVTYVGSPYAHWRSVSLIGIVPLLFAFLLILLWHVTS